MRRLRNCGQILGAEFVVFARGTTIHGVPNMAAKKLHPLERLFWSIIIALAIYAAILLSVQNVNRYYANPTVVSIQKDYRNWFNPFPSATACFVNKVDEVFVDEYIEETWGLNESDSKYEYYREFVTTVANISYTSLHRLEKFAQDDELKAIDLLELAAKVHPELTGNLVTFDTQRKTDWHLVMTELGICFSVNTKMAKHFTYSVMGPNSTIIGSSNLPNEEHILHCHYLNGLCYARYDSDPLAPLQIYVHSYLDIAHATSEAPLHVKESEELEINFKMQHASANPKLKTLSPAQRKCRFDDEPLTKDIPAYSTSICYMACRLKLVKKLCGCRPFFYHKFSGRECDLSELLCVAKYSKEITRPPTELGCNCPEPCDFIKYLAEAPKVTMWEYGYFDQRLTFRWGLLPPTTKYHRDIIFGFDDLIVSIGGTLALLLGVSFITAMEIIFFVIHLIIVVLLPRKQEKRLIKTKSGSNNAIKWNNPSKLRKISSNSDKTSKPQVYIIKKQVNRGTLFIPYLD
ncbi:acid-sensing ion channel 5-like [Atheta coriaria]|uniref:acid-sensing ion channel 5-like n=1 Tax=Dalotia coriaria TaxID=877792 RepID=UPI0031F4125E